MANKHQYNAESVAQALRDSYGIRSVAARRVGCNYSTIVRYIETFPTVAQAFKEARASIVDMAEGQLIKKLNAGEWPAVHYTLTTLGKDRGYGAQQDANIGLDMTIRVVYGSDDDSPTP